MTRDESLSGSLGDELAPSGSDEVLTTRDVARRLGVGEATVKRWSDAGLLECYRTPGAHRKFLRRDVDSFVRQRGLAPVMGPPPPPSGPEALRLARAADLEGLERMSLAALDGGMTVESLCDEVLAPALAEIGDLWACQSASIAEEHVVSGAIVALLARLRVRFERQPAEHRRVLIACVEGERHDIAGRMLALVLRSRGYTPVELGADVPANDIATMALAQRASLVMISGSFVGAGASRAREAADLLLRRFLGQGIRLVVGGGAFASRVPSGASHADDLRGLARLLDEALAPRAARSMAG